MTSSASEVTGRQTGERPHALEVRGLTKRFGSVEAVGDVSFTVDPDEIVCLVGPSGCGKSTLLRLVAGLITPDRGEIRSYGRVLQDASTSLPPERRGIGIVFQEPALFPNLTVEGNVAFGLPRRQRGSTRVSEMLRLVGLADMSGRYPHELSGGERQRVALARALAPAPSVLLLDEPFANLDQNLRERLRDDVMEILRRTGTPSLLVTHDQSEALALADRILVMRDGRIEQAGPPDEVFHRPSSRFVAEFLGEADFVPARICDDRCETELGSVPAPETVPGRADGLVMMVRPDDLVVEVVVSQGGGEPNARVLASEFQGGYRLVRLRLLSGTVVRARLHHSVEIGTGDEVHVRLDPHVTPVLFYRGDPNPGDPVELSSGIRKT
ncbi:MAG: ABC transporter [Acidimicrobiales bacterium]|nr:MAG: ABC transporter [Acidimicrobiales bacterium]